MEAIYLDTHIVVWLFSKELEKISKKALNLIEKNQLIISPMVELELEFLYEISRLRYPSCEIISSLYETIDLKICDISFFKISKEATKFNFTRDPFDRLIVANASYNDTLLISKDKNILNHYTKAIW